MSNTLTYTRLYPDDAGVSHFAPFDIEVFLRVSRRRSTAKRAASEFDLWRLSAFHSGVKPQACNIATRPTVPAKVS